MIDLRQTPEYAKYMSSIGWKVYVLDKNKIYVKSLPLIGKVAKLQRPVKVNEKNILKFIEKENIKAFYIEPQNGVKTNNFHITKSNFIPSKTIHIDLSPTEKDLLKKMHHKTRYNIKIATRNNVLVKNTKDIEEFNKLWAKTSFKRGTFLPVGREILELYKAFSKQCTVLLAYSPTPILDESVSDYTRTNQISFDTSPIAGVFICYSKDTAFYMYAASTDTGKQLFAPTLLVWKALKIAKRKGTKILDFEGIYDERYKDQTKAWKGFTRFKKGFGGQEITFPQTIAYKKSLLSKIFL